MMHSQSAITEKRAMAQAQVEPVPSAVKPVSWVRATQRKSMGQKVGERGLTRPQASEVGQRRPCIQTSHLSLPITHFSLACYVSLRLFFLLQQVGITIKITEILKFTFITHNWFVQKCQIRFRISKSTYLFCTWLFFLILFFFIYSYCTWLWTEEGVVMNVINICQMPTMC
jgi:hypothetical protein